MRYEELTDIYRQKAHECDRALTRAADAQVQASYRQMSRQWNEMAQRQQTIDEALAELLKPLEC
jgi:capsid protein